VPANDEVILNLANMSNVRSFDPMSGIIVAEAGCILENLSNYLVPHSHIIPLDLGAKGR
jgi:FAD/FMN-containing dehydrogenase